MRRYTFWYMLDRFFIVRNVPSAYAQWAWHMLAEVEAGVKLFEGQQWRIYDIRSVQKAVHKSLGLPVSSRKD